MPNSPSLRKRTSAVPERHRILIVDDDSEDRRAVRGALAGEAARYDEIEADVREAETVAEARTAVAEEEFSCIFLAHSEDGLDLLQDVRAQGLSTPVVVLTGTRDDQAILALMSAGAIDYVPKSELTPDLVARSLRAALRFQQAQREKQAALDAVHVRDRAIAAASNGIVIADPRLPDAPIIYANPAFLALSGYPEDEVVGYNCRFLQGSGTDPATVDALRAAIRAQRPIQVMILNHKKNGTPFWNEVTVSPVRDAAGQLTHFVGIQTDITDRILAERERDDLMTALVAGQEQLQAVQDGMSDGLIISDTEGNILTMNPVALRLHGFESADDVRRHLSEFPELFTLRRLDGTEVPLENWPLARALRGERFSDYEVQVTRRDTGRVWIASYSGGPILDKAGQPGRVLITLRDISERKTAEDAARQFQFLSDQAADGFFVMDAEGRFVYVNPAALRSLGYTAEQMKALHVPDIDPLHDDAAYRELFTRVQGEPVPPFESLHRRADGTTFSIEASVSRLTIAGRPLLFCSVRDITERKQAEAALAAAYEREHRIAESLQRSLLNRPPQDVLGSLEVETLYKAAWDEAQVGGDYHDVFALDGGQLALVVGDVSGKGLIAASRTAEIKYTLRAYLREHSGAASALTRLNSFLCEAQALEADPQDYFVVLTLAVVDTATGAVQVAVAGAEPPLLLRADGSAEEVAASGLPLGVAVKAEYQQTAAHLDPGDLLLVATDGITEARQGREFLGNDGLAALAARALAGGDTLAEVAEAILGGAQEFAEGKLHDDVCLLLARRR